MTHNHCQFCIGTHSVRGLLGSTHTVTSGDMCDLTHRAIRDNEITAGCEDYYDQAGTAYIIDVYSDIEYIDRQGNLMKSGKQTTRVIRPRYLPDTCEAWREVYQEALNLLAKALNLPINSDGKWLSTNIFRCRLPTSSDDHKSGVKVVKIVFTSSIYPHGEA